MPEAFGVRELPCNMRPKAFVFEAIDYLSDSVSFIADDINVREVTCLQLHIRSIGARLQMFTWLSYRGRHDGCPLGERCIVDGRVQFVSQSARK